MISSEILRQRFENSGLGQARFRSAAEAVSHLGAVQAQDFTAAKWALGLRVKNSTAESIETAFNEGKILRIHVMRPTWHFVVPEDIRWMIGLTAPRVKRLAMPSNRKIGIDEALLAKSNSAIVKALSDRRYLTRRELKAVLTKTGIVTNVQRLAHIIMRAELDGLICSGPLQGRQFTYALLEDRAEKAISLGREEALAKLALKYFTSHGPAQEEDFAWWSGLGRKDAAHALDAIRSELKPAVHNGKTYWSAALTKATAKKPPRARLLSIYDEYVLAYKDRSALSETGAIEKMIASGNASTAVIILNGLLAGTWKRSLKKDLIELRMNAFREFDKDERKALEAEADRYAKFMGIRAVIDG